MPYVPPYTISSTALKLVASICEQLGRFEGGISTAETLSPQLRRENRIQSIHASLAIENNTLSLEQVTDIIDGKIVLGPPRDIQEVHGAIAAYEKLHSWQPHNMDDLLSAHALLMQDLVPHPGQLRLGNVGIYKGEKVVHAAPPAKFIKGHLDDLLAWLKNSEEQALITSSIFHYEFEFIHPFNDGNGRMGRLWQTLILSKWKPFFAYLPVETIIRNRQEDYYTSLGQADKAGNSAVFIDFMLDALKNAITDLIDKQSARDTDLVSDLVSDPVSDSVTGFVKRLLKSLLKKEKSTAELMRSLSLKHVPTFRKNYLNPALEAGFIERTQPDTPQSPTQKYRLTAKGRKAL